MNLNQLRDHVHGMAVIKGWWQEPRTFGDIIALIHSEASEALEEYRNGRDYGSVYCFECKQEDCTKMKNGDSKPEGIPVELADIIIRVLDVCGEYNIDIDEALQAKMLFNATRSHRHGGKVL